MPLYLETAARSDIGLKRRRNEDAYYQGRFLLAVADGMGGHVAGDIASSTVIHALEPYDRATDPARLADALGRAIYEANVALRRRIADDADLTGMGTTLVALLWSQDHALIANIGDSRGYQLHLANATSEATPLIQITEDHTYGNLVADASNVPNLPERIARFLDGRADGRSPDLTTRILRAGDRLMLCSDGLSSVVPPSLIHTTLSSTATPQQTCDELIRLAIAQGAPDNITVIVTDVHDERLT